MRRLAAAIARWVVRYFLTFVFIVAVLIGAKLLVKEFDEYRRAQAELAALESGRQQVGAHLARLQSSLAARVAKLQKAPLDQLAARIASIDDEIRRLAAAQPTGLDRLSTLPLGPGFIDSIRRDAELKLLLQEREYLVLLRSTLETVQKGPAHLESLRQAHVAAHDKVKQNELARTELQRENPIASRVFIHPSYRRLQDLDETHGYLVEANNAAYRAYERQRRLIELAKSAPRQFELRSERVEEAMRPLHERIRQHEQRNVGSWIGMTRKLAVDVLPVALGILLAILLLPLALKALSYFVLAPVVARGAPVSVLPGASGAIATASPAGSSRSVALPLGEGEVLLVHPAYLQSSPAGARKDTKWLLDWAYPFSSLAAGMVALIRMRADKPETVVISATRDPLDEVGLLSLPASAAVVLQPRNLVAVACHQDSPLKITTHWRLGTLHAWLTLQLRYIVFHGPARLVVKGCRGVRVEPAGDGRRINAAATIGFSANLAYSSARSDTFVAYLMGEQDLFVDSFSGGDGVYIHEETQRAGSRGGIFGRGLEGLTDATLKAFGL